MAPTDIKTAVRKVQELARAVTGINDAPPEPQEDFVQMPFVVSYISPSGGRTEEVAGGHAAGGRKEEHHTIFTEIHVGRGLGGEAIEQALDLFPLVLDAIYKDTTLGDTVNTIKWPVRHGFGFLPWGASENVHVGWRFEIDVKLDTPVN